MHEMSIAQSLLEIVLEEGRQHKMEQVTVIRLQVGALAAVVPESLTFCFDMLSRDTIAASALLEIETVPVVARCSTCNTLFEVEDNIFLCPECGGLSLSLVSGRDMALVSIEGETRDDNGTDQCPSGSQHPAGQ